MTPEFNLKIVILRILINIITQIFFSDHAAQSALEILSHLTSSLSHSSLSTVSSDFVSSCAEPWLCGEWGQPHL